MYLAGIMKLNLRVIRLFRIEEPFTLGQVYRMPIFVLPGIGLFKPKEILQLIIILTGQPAGFIERK